MIDYIALFIGHGLIAIALLRLVMRDRLDVDPLLGSFAKGEPDRRKGRGRIGREGEQPDGGEPDPDPAAGPQPRRSARRTRSRQSRAQVARRSQKTRAQAADAEHSRRLNRSHRPHAQVAKR